MTLLQAIIYMMTYTSENKYIDVCAADISNLKLKNQIEISLGCSRVDGDRLYSNTRLWELYQDRE